MSDSGNDYPNFDADRDAAIDWARALMARPAGEWCLLDLETTGPKPDTCAVVQIGVLAPDGSTLLCTRVNPERPIPAEATRIHGLKDADVQDAPTFGALYEQLAQILAGRVVVIYNAGYDWRIITRLCAERGAQTPDVAGVNCAMLWYAQFMGAWNSYYGNYKWHKLPAAKGVQEHDAMGDCVSTLRLVEHMAKADTTAERCPVCLHTGHGQDKCGHVRKGVLGGADIECLCTGYGGERAPLPLAAEVSTAEGAHE